LPRSMFRPNQYLMGGTGPSPKDNPTRPAGGIVTGKDDSMNTLHFMFRGIEYKVNEKGFINGSSAWVFSGVSFHHWRRGIDVSMNQGFDDPKSLVGGLVWDVDHGTTRQWAGTYCNKLPRITSAWVQDGNYNIEK
jgi:hypothetical protein